MQPREVFGIVVRATGLVCFLCGLYCAMVWFQFATGFTHTLVTGVKPQTIFWLAVGVIFTRGADAITRFAYPSRRSEALISQAVDKRASTAAPLVSVERRT